MITDRKTKSAQKAQVREWKRRLSPEERAAAREEKKRLKESRRGGVGEYDTKTRILSEEERQERLDKIVDVMRKREAASKERIAARKSKQVASARTEYASGGVAKKKKSKKTKWLFGFKK
jgi:hypothetical protein|tara:strand:- start:3967 stop:4326 length:360 start_codon:yes stop_codon:yes gene_type:complete